MFSLHLLHLSSLGLGRFLLFFFLWCVSAFIPSPLLFPSCPNFPLWLPKPKSRWQDQVSDVHWLNTAQFSSLLELHRACDWPLEQVIVVLAPCATKHFYISENLIKCEFQSPLNWMSHTTVVLISNNVTNILLASSELYLSTQCGALLVLNHHKNLKLLQCHQGAVLYQPDIPQALLNIPCVALQENTRGSIHSWFD